MSYFTVTSFRRLSFGMRKYINRPVAMCVRVWLHSYPVIPMFVRMCAQCLSVFYACECACINVPRWGDGTPGRDANDRNVSPVNQALSTLPCWGGGGRIIWNASIPLMRKASVGELGVFKERNSDLRGKTKNEKQWKTACFSVFKVSQAACETSQPRLYRN